MQQLRRALFRLGMCLSLAGLVATAPLATASAAHPPKKQHPASSQPVYASIIMDAATGEILHQFEADQQSYPASLTKMMTLYVLFQRLAAGKVKFDTTFVVSAHAAKMEPSKLSLVPGTSVRLEDLMFGVVTKSANDAAVVIAEGLAGSEPAFAAEMTAVAHRLGMSRSNFVNASGLPNSEQVSTARDMAILGRALVRDFPNYYRFFDTRAFTYKGQVMNNHNHMLGAYDGLDGIKTGFIHASGFNLVASAKRDGRRLIGVVFGGTSAPSRDRHMAQLLDAAFENRAILPEMLIARGAPSRALALRSPPRRAPVEEGDAEDQAPPRSMKPAVKVAENALPEKPAATPKAARLQLASRSDGNAGWAVQVGAFKADKQARNAAQAAIKSARAELAHGRILVLKAGKASSAMHRARVTGLTEQQARNACRQLGKHGTTCVTVPPDASV